MAMSEALQPLTGSQVASLKKTFRVMDRDRLAMRFYSSLFARHPELKSLFPSDLTELSTKIVSVFELVVFSFQETAPDVFVLRQDVLAPLKGLGQLHANKGVENNFYPIVNDVLLDAIRDESPEFGNEIAMAWKMALNHLTVAMLSSPKTAAMSHETMRESFQHIKSLLFKTSRPVED